MIEVGMLVQTKKGKGKIVEVDKDEGEYLVKIADGKLIRKALPQEEVEEEEMEEETTAPKKRKKGGFRTDVQRVLERSEEDMGSRKYWVPTEGKNIIRILPPWNDKGLFYFTGVLHYGFSHDGRDRAYPCLLSLGESDCPVCDLVETLKDSTALDDKKLAKRMQPKTKHYLNILDKKRKSKSVQIYGCGSGILRRLCGYLSDPDWGDITDPEEGYDVVLERKGSGFETRYEVRLRPKPTPIGVEDWIGKLHDLSSEVIEPISYKELKSIVEDNYGTLEK